MGGIEWKGLQRAEDWSSFREGLPHDLMQPLPRAMGKFDAVVSALAIHHLPDERKGELFAEVFELLQSSGAFYDLDVVAAPTAELHALSQAAFGFDQGQQDPSDQPARLEDQLTWLHDAGFDNVDCSGSGWNFNLRRRGSQQTRLAAGGESSPLGFGKSSSALSLW